MTTQRRGSPGTITVKAGIRDAGDSLKLTFIETPALGVEYRVTIIG